MKDLTDEEYDALDDYYTANPPDVDPSKNGGFAAKPFRMVAVDSPAADWIMARALATNRTTGDIINEMIQKEIAAAQ